MSLRPAHLRKLPGLLLITLFLGGCGESDLNLDRRDEQHPLFRKAAALAESGRYDDALNAFENALQKKPELVRCHLESARILHEQKADYPSAIHHYRQYLRKRPDAQKAPLVNNWIEQAEASFASAMIQTRTPGVLAELQRLKRENNSLTRMVQQYQQQLKTTEPAAVSDATKPQSAVAPKPEQPAASVVAPKPAPPPARHRTYTVKSGDTLSRIARAVYNDSSRWQLIYQANRSAMRNERDLKVGQVLIIPEP